VFAVVRRWSKGGFVLAGSMGGVWLRAAPPKLERAGPIFDDRWSFGFQIGYRAWTW